VTDPADRTASDDDTTSRLLRLAGPRATVSSERAARVRSAVRRDWQIGIRRRERHRRFLIGALLAAGVLFVVFAGRSAIDSGPRPEVTAGVNVAAAEHIEGRVLSDSSDRQRRALQSNDPIRAGEWIETDENSRASLRFTQGISVRLDTGSRLRPLTRGAIELAAGAVYVDTEQEHGRFEVRTPLAVARDIGTQFEVRLIAGTLRLRVRSGEVELREGTRSVSGRSGTEITWSKTSAASRPFATHGPEWQWMVGLAPLAMEGQLLAAFLEQVAREQGWSVEYADARLASRANAIVLHGSVTGLSPHDAIATAIATSGLTHRIERGVVKVMESVENTQGETGGGR
jgi:ferric-dicitrate binding protein FerR (iron transport regulator)